MQWHPGNGVGMGKDYTLFAKQPGIVVYQSSKYIRKVRPLGHAMAAWTYTAPPITRPAKTAALQRHWSEEESMNTGRLLGLLASGSYWRLVL